MRRGNIDISFIIIVVILAGMSLREGAFTDPKTWFIQKLIIIPGIFVGLTFHEFAHAFVANRLGDPTPKLQGRVTLNPTAHIDLMGLICLFFVGFGWGRPVQIDPSQFPYSKRRIDEFLVSVAGVAMNFLIAFVFAFVVKGILVATGGGWMYSEFGQSIYLMLFYVIYINLVLMIFNLIPMPPLDGFNIIAQIGGFGQSDIYWTIYRYGSWILIALIVFNITSMIISPCVRVIYNFIAAIAGLPGM